MPGADGRWGDDAFLAPRPAPLTCHVIRVGLTLPSSGGRHSGGGAHNISLVE